jgi:prepilin-type processing-associated H-X9-DG protein
MLSENIQAGNYIAGYAPTNPADQYAFVTERLAGFVWDQISQKVPNHTNPTDGHRINADKDGKNINNNTDYFYARPSSRHPGGVNVAMCGGEMLFLREDIDYWVYEQLMTSNGPKSLMQVDTANPTNPATSNRAYILNDADYK